jgi:hypothetical protein
MNNPEQRQPVILEKNPTSYSDDEVLAQVQPAWDFLLDFISNISWPPSSAKSLDSESDANINPLLTELNGIEQFLPILDQLLTVQIAGRTPNMENVNALVWKRVAGQDNANLLKTTLVLKTAPIADALDNENLDHSPGESSLGHLTSVISIIWDLDNSRPVLINLEGNELDNPNLKYGNILTFLFVGSDQSIIKSLVLEPIYRSCTFDLNAQNSTFEFKKIAKLTNGSLAFSLIYQLLGKCEVQDKEYQLFAHLNVN